MLGYFLTTMPKVKAKTGYHGSDGYVYEGTEWDATEAEAAGLDKLGYVELVEEVKEKEDKQGRKTKEEK